MGWGCGSDRRIAQRVLSRRQSGSNLSPPKPPHLDLSARRAACCLFSPWGEGGPQGRMRVSRNAGWVCENPSSPRIGSALLPKGRRGFRGGQSRRCGRRWGGIPRGGDLGGWSGGTIATDGLRRGNLATAVGCKPLSAEAIGRYFVGKARGLLPLLPLGRRWPAGPDEGLHKTPDGFVGTPHHLAFARHFSPRGEEGCAAACRAFADAGGEVFLGVVIWADGAAGR